MKLGAYLIVKNEESCINDCLDSIIDFDEITVLDTGSTDATPLIVKEYDCNYIEGKYEWKDDFADARNESMKYSSADWLFVIDADEVFEGDITKLKEMIDVNKRALSFTIDTVSSKDDSQVHKSVRLHKNCPEVFWSGVAHNYLSVKGDKWCPYATVKYGYSAAHHLDPDRTFRILTRYVTENPKCTRERYYLAREHYYRSDWETAIYHWEKYLENAYFGGEMADAYLFIARCYHALGKFNEARFNCLRAVNINANFREAWRFLASMCGPGNKKCFNRIADESTNQGVLFIRGV